MDDEFKQFCISFYNEPSTIRIIEKQRNLESDRPSERLQIGEKMSSLLRAAAGSEIRYAAGNAMIPANFQGWIFKYHIPRDNNDSVRPKYTFTGLGNLLEQIKEEVSCMTEIICATCGEHMTLDLFTKHYENEHKHEIILINIGDQLGTNTRTYSNLLHYVTIKLMSLAKGNTSPVLDTVMNTRATISSESRWSMSTILNQAANQKWETQQNYIQELERQLENPEASKMKELIGNQQLKVDSQKA